MIRRLDRIALLLGALGLILALPVLTYPLGRDQGMYANIAQAIRAGGLPFIDMWDIKPPAIYYIYAAGISVFGATPVALRALDLLAAPLTMLALFQLTDALAGRRAARWAMLLFPVFYFTETFASLTQSDSLVILPMTWAVLCALRAAQAPGGSRRARVWSFACGLLCAAVIWFKHYYVIFAAALALAHLWQRRRSQKPKAEKIFNHRDTESTEKHGGDSLAESQRPTANGQQPIANSQKPIANSRSLAAEIAAFAAGGLAVGIPSIIYFASNGILDQMLIIARGTSQYNGAALSSLSAFWTQMGNYVWFRWWHWGPLIVLAVSYWLLAISYWLLAFSFQSKAKRKLNHRDTESTEKSGEGFLLSPQPSPLPPSFPSPLSPLPSPLLFLWLLAGGIFVVIQAKGFDTHWIPLLPPLVILAARALDGWLTLIERAPSPLGGRGGWGARGLSLLCVVLFGAILAKDTWARAWPYLTGQESQRAYLSRFQAGDLNAGQSFKMARWLKARTNAGDSVYIWGFRPEVAFMAGLRPATRFQAQFALVGDRYPQAWKQENVDTLWAALPEYVLVVRADNMPWVTGSGDDSNTILANEYQALRDWLIYNYDRDAEVDNFLIWRRKT